MKTLIAIFLSIALPALAASDGLSLGSSGSSSGTSAMNRANKNFSVAAQLAGYGGPAPDTLSQGVSVGAFAGGDWLFSVEAMSGRRALGNWFWSGNGEETNAKSLGLSLKKFTGNSLYMRMGATYRKVSYRQYWEDIIVFNDGSHPGESAFEGEAMNASFGFGNQWQIAGFSIGVDWVGVEIPVTSRVNSESVSGDTTNARTTDYATAKKHNLSETTFSIARFSLGASF